MHRFDDITPMICISEMNRQKEHSVTRNSILHALVPDDYRGDCFGFLRQRTTPILFYFSMDHNFKMIRQTISFAFAFVFFSSLVYYSPALPPH